MKMFARIGSMQHDDWVRIRSEEVMAKSVRKEVRINRKVLSIANLKDKPDDVRYWLSRPPWARWQHMEFLRRINYGNAVFEQGLKRVLEIAQLEKS